MSVEQKSHRFPSTHWSGVRLAVAVDFQDRQKALEALLLRYWQPLKAHLAAKFQLSEDRIEDLLQSFVLHRVLLKDLFAKADRARGRFRTFLLNAVDNFVLNELRDERARKRTPEAGIRPYDELTEAEHPFTSPPDLESTDVVWARAVLAEAVRRMEAECVESKRLVLWQVFERRLLRPILRDEAPIPYERLVTEHGLGTPAQAYKTLHLANTMFGAVLRSVIAEYASDEKDIERELEDWKSILANAARSHR